MTHKMNSKLTVDEFLDVFNVVVVHAVRHTITASVHSTLQDILFHYYEPQLQDVLQNKSTSGNVIKKPKVEVKTTLRNLASIQFGSAERVELIRKGDAFLVLASEEHEDMAKEFHRAIQATKSSGLAVPVVICRIGRISMGLDADIVRSCNHFYHELSEPVAYVETRKPSVLTRKPSVLTRKPSVLTRKPCVNVLHCLKTKLAKLFCRKKKLPYSNLYI